MAYKVVFWDGTTKPAKDQEGAVKVAKEGLQGWMQGKDYIAWPRAPGEKFPSIAVVCDEYGDSTDAYAVIKETD